MKKLLIFIVINFVFLNTISLYAGEFQIETKLSLQNQYKYKKSLDNGFKKIEKTLSQLNESTQINKYKELIKKLTIIKNASKNNDKNNYICSYLIFLINEQLNKLTELESKRSNEVNNELSSDNTKYLLTVGEVEFLSDLNGFIYIRSSGDIRGRFGEGEKSIIYMGKSDYRIYQPGGFYLSSEKNIYIYIPRHNEKKDIKSEGVYKIEGADIYSFEVIDNKFSLDGTCGNAINSFAKDKNHVYYLDMIIEGANPNTFESLWGGYGKDDTNYYYNQYKLSSIDINTFKVLDKGYSKDKNYVYTGNEMLKGADINSFEVLIYCKAKDKNNSYEYGQLVK